MTLHAIVRALGGDLYQGGTRASIPAPGHSGADRSISLWLANGRVIAHGFGGSDWKAALDVLRARGLIDARGQPAGEGRPGPPPSAIPGTDRRDVARRLWEAAIPIASASLSARHLRRRRVPTDPGSILDLRHHPAAPLSVYGAGRATRPALMAAVRDPSGRLSAVEITYLDPSGHRAVGLSLPRKTIGVVPPGSAVRLAAPGADHLVGEGVATTLSAMARFVLPGWALLSVRNLAAWSPPPEVRRVLIAADRGRPGEAAALRLRLRLSGLGVPTRVAFPPPAFGDWNEAAPPWP